MPKIKKNLASPVRPFEKKLPFGKMYTQNKATAERRTLSANFSSGRRVSENISQLRAPEQIRRGKGSSEKKLDRPKFWRAGGYHRDRPALSLSPVKLEQWSRPSRGKKAALAQVRWTGVVVRGWLVRARVEGFWCKFGLYFSDPRSFFWYQFCETRDRIWN